MLKELWIVTKATALITAPYWVIVLFDLFYSF